MYLKVMAGDDVEGVKDHKVVVVSVAQPRIGLSGVKRIRHNATCNHKKRPLNLEAGTLGTLCTKMIRKLSASARPQRRQPAAN